MGVEFEMPDIEAQVMAALQERIDAALAVAAEVPGVIKDIAAIGNVDVNGNQFPEKQPRPKRHPENFPNLALVQTGNMLDNSRWTVERISDTEVAVVYSPPEYFEALISKDPAKGGRPWMTPDKINDDARAIIEERMILAAQL